MYFKNSDAKNQMKTLIRIGLLSVVCCFLYCLSDAILLSGDYKVHLYSTGFYGISDAIGKVFNLKQYFFGSVGIFNALCYAIINFILFYAIAFPKLNRIFNITTFLHAFFFVLFIAGLGYLINGNNALFQRSQYCFGQFDGANKDFLPNFYRGVISAILDGLLTGYCIKIGSSTGGIDIIAKYLDRYHKKDISLIITILSYAIAFIAAILEYCNTRTFEWKSLVLTNLVKIPLCSLIIYFLNRKKL